MWTLDLQAPNWHLPEKEMPLVFEDRTVAELCTATERPSKNGHKTLDHLYLHVAHDPLVLWGWEPVGIAQRHLFHMRSLLASLRRGWMQVHHVQQSLTHKRNNR